MIFHEVCMQTIYMKYHTICLRNMGSVAKFVVCGAFRAMAFLTLRKHCNFRPWSSLKNDLSAYQVILQVLRSQPAKLYTFSAIFEHCILTKQKREKKSVYTGKVLWIIYYPLIPKKILILHFLGIARTSARIAIFGLQN